MKKNLLRIIFVILILLSILFFYLFKLNRYFSYENVLEVKEFIIGLSYFGPIIIILLFVVLNLMIIPNVFFVFLSGYLYGLKNGLILGWAGTILGFTVSFLCVRYLYRDLISKKYSKRKLVIQIEEYTEKYHGWAVLFFRIVFAIPYSVQNAAYALTSINFFTYLIASIIGSIPQTLIFVFLGYYLESGKINFIEFKNIFLLIVVIITVIISIFFTTLLIKNRKKS